MSGVLNLAMHAQRPTKQAASTTVSLPPIEMVEVSVSFRCSTRRCFKAKMRLRTKDIFEHSTVICSNCGCTYQVRAVVTSSREVRPARWWREAAKEGKK